MALLHVFLSGALLAAGSIRVPPLGELPGDTRGDGSRLSQAAARPAPAIAGDLLDSAGPAQGGPLTTAEAARAPLPDREPGGVPGQRQTGTAWFRDRNVTYQLQNGRAIFEGDIDLGPVGLLEPARAVSKDTRREGIGITAANYRWPGGVLPYVIDPSITYRQVVLDAIDHWNNTLAGVIRIVPRTSESNYVEFRDSSGCSSNVGMLGYGAQQVNLSVDCGFGATVHEIGHALGLFHEQSREDRDRYIRVLYENVSPGMAVNFEQANSFADDMGAYDYNSIMHYGAFAFSANGQPTIETIPAGIPIGQRAALSSGDISAIRALYASIVPPAAQQPLVPVTIASNPPGLRVTVDGASVGTPAIAIWTPGSLHTITAVSPQFVGNARHEFAGWSDGAARTHTLAAPASATVLKADFARFHKVTATAAGGGTVTVAPGSGDGYYAENSTVTLSATPAPGYCFAGWTGLLDETPAIVPLLVSREYTISATFVQSIVRTDRAADWFPVAGGQTDLAITAAGCKWQAITDAPWIHLAAGATNLRITIEPNPARLHRIGIVRIGTAPYVILQAAF